jgi:hypothetical protein
MDSPPPMLRWERRELVRKVKWNVGFVLRVGTTAVPGKRRSEEMNLFYEFTVNGDEVFCREGYADAEGLLAHLDNIGALLAEALKIADLIQLEVHGPAAELDKLRGPMAHLNPSWFVLDGEL